MVNKSEMSFDCPVCLVEMCQQGYNGVTTVKATETICLPGLIITTMEQ